MIVSSFSNKNYLNLKFYLILWEEVVVISSDKVEGSGDWNSLEFQDTANSKKKKETKAMVFHQMETEEVSDRFMAPYFVNGLEVYDGEINLGVEENMISNETGTVTIYPEFDPFLENIEEEEKSNDDWDHLLDFNLDDVPLLVGGHLTQEEAAKQAIAIRISQKFALLEEERPIIETMAYHDKYKKILDEVWKGSIELDGKVVKEDKDAVKRIKGEALKEKDDPGAFIFPIRLEGHVDKNALADTSHQTFRAARLDVMRNTESDSDDEKDYQIKRNKFGAPIYRPKPTPYLNCNDTTERLLAIQTGAYNPPGYAQPQYNQYYQQYPPPPPQYPPQYQQQQDDK
uniref:Uncharacterized protein n=1 Tax=Tanacetum cinerariifolium TaxID=118510 RepID=A0A6L2KPU2_TANCI|nr:hypothetical protein [Tanacetum cinerariifolium]